jgi:hypothetical protein
LVTPESRKTAAIYKLGGGYDLIHPKEKKVGAKRYSQPSSRWVRNSTPL